MKLTGPNASPSDFFVQCKGAEKSPPLRFRIPENKGTQEIHVHIPDVPYLRTQEGPPQNRLRFHIRGHGATFSVTHRSLNS